MEGDAGGVREKAGVGEGVGEKVGGATEPQSNSLYAFLSKGLFQIHTLPHAL